MIEKTNNPEASANGTASLQNASEQESNILTTRQGHPVYDNQNLRTVGNRGPATLENYHFLEKSSILHAKKQLPTNVTDKWLTTKI